MSGLPEEDQGRLSRQWYLSNGFVALTYAFLVTTARLYFRYNIRDVERFRREVWEKLDSHKGPVIWAANHLTLIDSFIIFWAVFPWHKVWRVHNLPWNTPEYTNYYRFGGFFRRPAIYFFMYLCRCIPFIRGGEDEASVRFREKAFEKCVWILREGGTVFVFPEAMRARNGWFDKNHPKEFLASLWQRVPKARVLTIYLRSEDQIHLTAYPPQGGTFRAYAEWYDPEPDASTRAVSIGLYEKLAGLQERWFAESPLAKNCGGNDVIDLKTPLRREHFQRDGDRVEADPDWLDRHLTDSERKYLDNSSGEDVFLNFWRFMAAKEACHKALAQSGIVVPSGAFKSLEVDLFRKRCVHRPTRLALEIGFPEDDEDKIHCVAILRGGSLDTADGGDVLSQIDVLPPGQNPSDYVRQRCLELIAEASDDIPSSSVLAFSEAGGVPRVLRGGTLRDWGVSLSHSGRYVAYSFMIS